MYLPFTLRTSLPKNSQHAVERWLATPSTSRYVFGRTQIARKILQHYSAAGVVDDFTQELDFDGHPIVRSTELRRKSPVLSAVIGKPATVKRVCEQQGLDHVDFFAFQKHCDRPEMSLRFWHESPVDIVKHVDAYSSLWSSLADDESREVLTSVLSLRLSGDLSVMEGFTERQHEQYFENFLNLKSDGEVFLDVGGYDGATSIEFARLCPAYEAIHVFEPDPMNIAILDTLTKSMPRMKIHPIALGRESAALRLTSNLSRSQVSTNGEHSVKQVRLDDLELGHGSLLKMDIEGAELGAIEGAKEFIRQHQPRLAIAAYHKVDDLWRIPAAIAPLMDAEIYLRHYTEGLDETVLFFIPRS
jgi:FkbM family methyltransferase